MSAQLAEPGAIVGFQEMPTRTSSRRRFAMSGVMTEPVMGATSQQA